MDHSHPFTAVPERIVKKVVEYFLKEGIRE